MLKRDADQGIFLIQKDNFVFSFQLIKNPDLAFSLSLPQTAIFLIISAIIIVLGIFLYKSFKKGDLFLFFSFLLIISGAISNLIDRIIHGAVIDFISFNIVSFQFAVFNLADVWIVLGVALLIFKEPFKVK